MSSIRDHSATSIREDAAMETSSTDPMSSESWYACGWNNIVTSCAENFCAFQDLDEVDDKTRNRGTSRERGFLDPHNFTIKHNDSMSTAATGEIDPEKIFAEHLSPSEALASFKPSTSKIDDESSIASK